MNSETQYQSEEEIDLMDYLKVLLKRKWVVFGIFLLSVIAAGVLSFLMPKVYKIDTILEIGKVEKVGEEPIQLVVEKIERDTDGTVWEIRRVEKAVEDPVQLVRKIERDVYGVKIRENLQIPKTEWPKIKVENPRGTNLIVMAIESDEPEKAKQILEEENRLILADHQGKIEIQKTLIEKNIKTAEKKIKLTESDIQKTRNKIETINADIERIKNKIVFTEEEKENLEAKVSALEQQLIYEQIPGTQFALSDAKEKLASKKQEIEDLYLRINSLRGTKEDLEVKINSLMENIENLNAQINSLRVTLEEIRSTKIVKNPTVSKEPVSPKKKLNIAIGGVLGLFLGVFLAFGREWWEQNNLKSQK